MVITTSQLHSTKSKPRFCAGSNPARDVSEVAMLRISDIGLSVADYFNSPQIVTPPFVINQSKMTPLSHNKLENTDFPQVIMTPLISIANQWRVNINWWKNTPWNHCSAIRTVIFDIFRRQWNATLLILCPEQQELKPFPKSRRNWRTSFWNVNKNHASARISTVPIF